MDRFATHDFVHQIVEWFDRERELAIVIAPEGTRSRKQFWHSGFYWIAHGAGVPIVLGFVNYERRVGGIGESFMPSGDIQADMDRISAFYAKKAAGKNPEKSSPIRIRPGDVEAG